MAQGISEYEDINLNVAPHQLVTAASADQVITQNSTSVMKKKGERAKRRNYNRKEDISRIISVYYNFSLVFILLAIISISNNNIVPTKVISKVWEHGDNTENTFNGARNMSSHNHIDFKQTPNLDKLI